MYSIFTFVIISLFLTLLFLNIYFRVKVLKVYKKLVQNQVEFNISQVMDRQKLEVEVLSKYPNQSEDILAFARHIRTSVNIGVILVVLISIMALVLHWYRD